MSIWAEIHKIIKRGGTASTVLDKLASRNIARLVTLELPYLRGQALSEEASKVLGSVFDLAADQLRSGLEYDFFGELILLVGELGGAGFHIPEAFDFLQSVFEHPPKNKYEATYSSQAVDSLLKCLKTKNPILIEAALLVFCIVIARIPGPDRTRLLEAAKNLSPNTLKEPLVSSLKRYHARLTRIDEAIGARKWTVNDPLSVITIHSHKGGVGKTTVAITLAWALAKKRRRVCVVDCDDEGPSLHFYLPVDATKQKEVLFFCDWFCTDQKSLLKGLIQPIHGVEGVSFIAGSFLGVDITRLDEYVAKARQRSIGESQVEGRIVLLLQLLLNEGGFNSIILDTSPGIDRLSLDVLSASIRVKGSRVFVMRPRPIDIGQLCFEEDWIVAQTIGGSNEIVLNYFHSEGKKALNLLDPVILAKELIKWPQFAAYSKRFFSKDISQQLQEMVQLTWPKFKVAKLHHAKGLQKAGSLQGLSLIDIIKGTHATIHDADLILNQIQDGWCKT